MKDYTTCPICNKTDIPNFINEDVVCPCCGADLSIYREIESAEKSSEKKSKKMVCRVGTLCGIVIVILLIGYPIIISSKNKEVTTMNGTISSLEIEKDSLSNLVKGLQIAGTQGRGDEHIFIPVRKGDSFCRISKRIYGKENRAEEIAEINNLTLSAIIHEGDTLKLKLRDGTNILD